MLNERLTVYIIFRAVIGSFQLIKNDKTKKEIRFLEASQVQARGDDEGPQKIKPHKTLDSGWEIYFAETKNWTRSTWILFGVAPKHLTAPYDSEKYD